MVFFIIGGLLCLYLSSIYKKRRFLIILFILLWCLIHLLDKNREFLNTYVSVITLREIITFVSLVFGHTFFMTFLPTSIKIIFGKYRFYNFVKYAYFVVIYFMIMFGFYMYFIRGEIYK
ncbi:hypothetical protein A6A20_11290 [Volucribacter amazonae]|uniref:Uncharacterized protein n=1 Tax=Volucribacter amazonae TaxID=256731 RepID=A0A9X4PDA3_9PAST|nr:hypothetical protein [Volucribacter amazonae]